jgi:hypothetical protein
MLSPISITRSPSASRGALVGDGIVIPPRLWRH